ncbi:MAG: LytTR family DNA-binding domain-containing protein [Reichenbachiella sp.]|uniref:LytR/AlgR family response regulator transcription factor n=1 Tax=Reichenbachiella sp. TaxID=2184521 RepID=UPI003262D25C
MIKTLIIDEERETRELLRSLILKYCKQAQIVGMAKSVEEGLKCVEREAPDLVLLDFNLHDKSSFDFVDQVPILDFEVIFITPFEQRAIKAIESSNAAYLLKPIGLNQVKSIMKRMVDKLDSPAISRAKGTIPLPDKDGIFYVNLNDIVRFEASGAYCKVYFVDGSNLMMSKHLKYFENLISQYVGYQYLRIHQSHLINLLYVKKYIKSDGGYVIMKDDSHVILSKRHRKDFIMNMAKV